MEVRIELSHAVGDGIKRRERNRQKREYQSHWGENG
jgi:hypothetical protein